MSTTKKAILVVSFGTSFPDTCKKTIDVIEQRIGEAEKLGFKRFLLPKYNLQGIDTQKLKIELVPVRKVEEAFRALFG